MDTEKINQSKTFKGFLIAVAATVVVLGVFKAGMVVGYYKAKFAGDFANNFERNFGPRGDKGGVMMNVNYRIPGGHGAVGEVVSINLPRLIVAGPDKLEKTVLISTSTLVRSFQDEGTSTDLKVGDSIVVLGNPNSAGEVEAKLIRIMPSPVK